MKQHKDSGFTLIELMIVVAIIGILAAIAIPQFSQYRIKAFNSASQSDMRNIKLSEEALYADDQEYGVSTLGIVALAAATASVEVTSVTGGSIANSKKAQSVSLSSNVSFITAADALNLSVMVATHHNQGDRTYAADSDGTSIYYVQSPTYIGLSVAATSALPAATVRADDLAVAPWVKI